MKTSLNFSILCGLAFTAFPFGAVAKPDSLVSESLQKRDAGFANGGKHHETYPLTFYHINDVHAYVFSLLWHLQNLTVLGSHLDQFRSSGASCTNPSLGRFIRLILILQNLICWHHRMCWRICKSQVADWPTPSNKKEFSLPQRRWWIPGAFKPLWDDSKLTPL